MKRGRRALCFVLTVILVLSTALGGMTASAAKKAKVKVGSKIVSGAYKYQVRTLKGTKGTAALIGTKSKKLQNVKIPETVKSGKYTFTVVEIGNNAFKSCKNLRTVKTNSALQTIGNNAFKGCAKLEKLEIGSKNLKKVGANALKGAKNVTLLVPGGMENTYAREFNGKGQKAIRLASTGVSVPQPVVSVPQTEANVPQPTVSVPQTEANVPQPVVSAPQPDMDQPQPDMDQPDTDTVQPETDAGQPETEHVHRVEKWEEIVAPSCKTVGRRKGICEECKETVREVIPALTEHKLTIELPDEEPTCEGWGKHNVKQCEVCGQIFFEMAGEQPLGHDFSDQYTVDVPATGTKPGLQSRHCKRVGCTATTDPQEIPATGETEEESETETEHVHQWSDYTRKVEPTCVTMGLEERHCDTCGATETKDIPANRDDHQKIELEDVEPTCTTWGKHSYWKCAVCGQEFFDVAGEQPLGHDFDTEYTEDIAATCTTPGRESKHCKREGCGATTEAREIQAKGHSWGQPVETPATCTAYGYTKTTCTVCGAEQITKTAEPSGHQWEEQIVQPATCQSSGIKKNVCRVCHQESAPITIPAGGHKPVEETIEATCEHAGCVIERCEYCQTIISQTIIPALGHTFEDAEVRHEAGSCSEKGTVTKHCSACGQDIVVQSLGFGEHNYGEDDVCDTCGWKKDSVKFSGHIWYVTYKADLESCVGFNGNGTGDTKTISVRGDVPISMKAPDARPGYRFKGWQITVDGTVTLVDEGNPNRTDTFEQVLRELKMLGQKDNWTNKITIEAVYEAVAAA